MKKPLIFYILALTSVIFWSACEGFVTGVDPLTSQVEDDRLTNEENIPFIIIGVKAQFSSANDVILMRSDLLSDALFYDEAVSGATRSDFERLDEGQPELTDIDDENEDVGELRLFADDLVRRVGKINFEDQGLKQEALFTGYLFGGIARYYYAAYFGLNPNEGGATIDAGPFISSNDMYDLAIEKFQLAIEQSPDDHSTRFINSLIGRCYLYKEEYQNAAVFAGKGLREGDEPFQSPHDNTSRNEYWVNAGHGRTQGAIDWRFKDYVEADPEEAARITLYEALSKDETKTFYFQEKYATEDAPLPIISWRENELILAELDARNNNASGALTRVNRVRASHGLAALDAIDMDGLIVERDKELFASGTRLIDQRRFNLWHLDDDDWRYIPLSQEERSGNPNLGGGG